MWRFALYEHRKSQGDRTNASVPAGTLVPAGEREFGGSAIVSLGNICACAGAAMAAIASKANQPPLDVKEVHHGHSPSTSDHPP